MISKKESPKILRKKLLRTIEKDCNDENEVALMLSSGIDSSAILYSLLELGITVKPYTFYLENYQSKDLKGARRLSKLHNLKLTEVEIPRKKIKENILYLAKIGCTRKTQFETKIHYLHLFPKIKEKYVFWGIEADNLQGTVRSMILQSSKEPLKFNQLRQKAHKYALEVNMPIDNALAKQNGLELKSPYVNEEIYKFYMQFDWQYLNKPYNKWILINAFKDYFEQDGYRKHLDMQQASAMKEYCATLVNDKDLNPENRKRINEAYKDLYRKYNEVK